MMPYTFQQIIYMSLCIPGGILGLWAGIAWLKASIDLRRDGVRTTAVVVGYEKRQEEAPGTRNRLWYHAQVEFVDLLKRKQRVTLEEGDNPPPYAVNSTVKIIYMPGDLSTVGIDNLFAIFMFPIFLLFSGCFGISSGLYVMIMRPVVGFHFFF